MKRKASTASEKSRKRSGVVRRRPSSPTRRKRPQKRDRFLAEYRRTGNIKASAQFANVDRSTVYDWQNTDEAFSAALHVALDEYVDTLETEADRRAVEGVDEPVFYQGAKCGNVRRYSDTLLMFRLNGLRPEKYKRVERHELTGKNGGPIKTVPTFDLSKLSGKQLEALDVILVAAGETPDAG